MNLLFKAVVVALALLGIVINTYQSDHVLESFSYYTLQSNLFVLVIFSVIIYRRILNRDATRTITLLKAMATVGIMITMLIYHFTLRPFLEGMNGIDYTVGDVRDLLLHYLVPSAAFMDWVLFDRHTKLHVKDPIIFLIQPFVYLFYTIIYTSLGGIYRLGDTIYYYPYFFLDVSQYGYFGVFLWSLLILMFYLILGYGLFVLHRFRRKVL